MAIDDLLYFHIPTQNFFIRPRLPDQVSRHAVDVGEIVKRDEGRFLHDGFAGLLQQGDALFLIRGFLLLLYDLVELRIAIIRAFGCAGAKILIIERVGVGEGAAPDVIERQLAAVDSLFVPE